MNEAVESHLAGVPPRLEINVPFEAELGHFKASETPLSSLAESITGDEEANLAGHGKLIDEAKDDLDDSNDSLRSEKSRKSVISKLSKGTVSTLQRLGKMKVKDVTKKVPRFNFIKRVRTLKPLRKLRGSPSNRATSTPSSTFDIKKAKIRKNNKKNKLVKPMKRKTSFGSDQDLTKIVFDSPESNKGSFLSNLSGMAPLTSSVKKLKQSIREKNSNKRSSRNKVTIMDQNTLALIQQSRSQKGKLGSSNPKHKSNYFQASPQQTSRKKNIASNRYSARLLNNLVQGSAQSLQSSNSKFRGTPSKRASVKRYETAPVRSSISTLPSLKSHKSFRYKSSRLSLPKVADDEKGADLKMNQDKEIEESIDLIYEEVRRRNASLRKKKGLDQTPDFLDFEVHSSDIDDNDVNKQRRSTADSEVFDDNFESISQTERKPAASESKHSTRNKANVEYNDKLDPSSTNPDDDDDYDPIDDYDFGDLEAESDEEDDYGYSPKNKYSDWEVLDEDLDDYEYDSFDEVEDDYEVFEQGFNKEPVM